MSNGPVEYQLMCCWEMIWGKMISVYVSDVLSSPDPTGMEQKQSCKVVGIGARAQCDCKRGQGSSSKANPVLEPVVIQYEKGRGM